MIETDFTNSIAIGDSGTGVRRVQEWLTLNQLSVVVDGQFGPATETAVKFFQKRKKLPSTGVVDATTFAAFVAPLSAATAPIIPTASLGDDICRCALQHIAQKPREVGGPNSGPWVRLYMDGAQGTNQPWCAGFATYVMKQAAGQRPLNTVRSASCNELAVGAKSKGTFQNGDGIAFKRILPGSLFLIRKPEGGWHHTGIVIKAAAQSLTTIEGNTNDSGSREGFEAIQRIRGYVNLDFILMS